jgi:hypothetical protein
LLGGNFYPNNVQMGRYDADYGSLLINIGNGSFRHELLNGLAIKGEVRHIRQLLLGKSKAYILARNDDSLIVIKTKS